MNVIQLVLQSSMRKSSNTKRFRSLKSELTFSSGCVVLRWGYLCWSTCKLCVYNTCTCWLKYPHLVEYSVKNRESPFWYTFSNHHQHCIIAGTMKALPEIYCLWKFWSECAHGVIDGCGENEALYLLCLRTSGYLTPIDLMF